MYAGSLVALVTPMQPDGSIDFDAWSRLLEFQVSNGTSGIVVAGSTGESATVTDAELAELLLAGAPRHWPTRAAHRQHRHQRHRSSLRARARIFRQPVRRRRPAGRDAVVCAAHAGRSVPAFLGSGAELARSRAAVQRAEPYRGRHAAADRRAAVARAEHRRASRKRWATPRACASWSASCAAGVPHPERRRSHGARNHRGRCRAA